MRPACLYPLFSSVETIKGMGPKASKLFKNLLGKDILLYLLFHRPIAILSRPRLTDAGQVKNGDRPTFKVRILSHIRPHSRKAPYRILCQIESFKGTELEIVFFNYHKDYLVRQLPEGEIRCISGAVEWYNGRLQMTHPDYITDALDDWKIPLIEPVYPLTQGLTNKMVEFGVREAIKALPSSIPEWLDETLLRQTGWPDFKTALMSLHHPKSADDLSNFNPARARLAYDEILANQLALSIMRTRFKKQKGNTLKGTGVLTEKLKQMLPFDLTGAQKRVIGEIGTDMASDFRMNRLLQGDVGSGKTIVALFALLQAIEAGAQGALMCPTDILSRQHYKKLSDLCEKLGVSVVLLTGREKGKTRAELLSKIANGSAQIIIGTHALFTADVVYHNLKLVIIDEQHRFGVEQRLFLTQKGLTPDLLVMTATPIPRTLALTYYGDMDVSAIDEKPALRQSVDTRVIPAKAKDETIAKLAHVLQSGKQIYWVCPLVEESEKSDMANATDRFKELAAHFPNRVGLVHGKMKGAEKDAVMQSFLNKELMILVATTVIEVGVDVPDATVMIVEQAERFGLAQLHQLRGRIGRGADKSTCLLMYDYPLSEVAKKRLEVMRQTDNGFIIAEQDLKLRGAGEVLGTRQSGIENMRLSDFELQNELIASARADASNIIKTDPNLQTPRGQALKMLMYFFEKDVYIPTIMAG